MLWLASFEIIVFNSVEARVPYMIRASIFWPIIKSVPIINTQVCLTPYQNAGLRFYADEINVSSCHHRYF